MSRRSRVRAPYRASRVAGDSSDGRAVDCRSTGRVFDSPSPDLVRFRKKSFSPWKFFSRDYGGRVVKAIDLKSIGLSPRKFESCP
jgi:hypothetical protein